VAAVIRRTGILDREALVIEVDQGIDVAARRHRDGLVWIGLGS
jgi:hypothetical protein